jgi:hypothetical protein
MTKAEEIQILTETAEKLGSDSYMGDWLKNQLPFIADSIGGDMFPISISQGDRIACSRISDAEMAACKLLAAAESQASGLIASANLQATDMVLAARKQADSVGEYARTELNKALNDASYAAGVLVKAINEL